MDGWVPTLYNDCDALDYCDSYYGPECRAYTFDSLQSYSTDPVELLSTWKHTQLESSGNHLVVENTQTVPF